MIDGGVAVGDHVRPTENGRDSRVPDGVYRVVGTSEGAVTLLLVGDAAGRRVYTGEVTTVSREALDSFETAANPDANRALAVRVIDRLDGIRWSLWALRRSVRTRPVPGAIAIVLLLVGVFGEGIVPLSAPALTALTLLGALLLVYLGRTGPA